MPRPRVLRGAALDVELTVERAGVSGELPITITGLPEGVTATAPAIGAGANTTALRFTDSASATVGVAAITISAPNVASLATSLVVAGAPGTLDVSLDSDGFFIDTSSATLGWSAVALQADGKIVVAGTTNINSTTTAAPSGWTIRRFGPNGEIDAAFDTAAAAAMPTTGAARGVAVDATGKILVAGYSRATQQITVIRLNANGSIDQGFADAGIYVADTASHGAGSRAHAVTVDSSGRIVVAGTNGAQGVVERYTTAGVPDPMFVRFETADSAELNGVVALADGSYAIGGTDVAASPDFQLAVRLLSNGTPDAAFGIAGRISVGSGCRGRGFTVLSDGTLFLVGDDQTAPRGCSTRVPVPGTVTTEYTSFGSNGQILGATAGASGTSYAVGHAGCSQDRYGFVERRLATGALDPTFAAGGGSPGVLVLEDTVGVPDTFRWVLRGVLRANDGQLLVVGNRTGTSSGAFLARIWE